MAWTVAVAKTVQVESLAFYIARLDDLNRQIKLRSGLLLA